MFYNMCQYVCQREGFIVSVYVCLSLAYDPAPDKVFVSVLTCVCVGIFLFLCVPSGFFFPLSHKF